MDDKGRNEFRLDRLQSYGDVQSAPRSGALDPSAAAVLRNTYMLLSLTIAFSAAVSWFSLDAQPPGLLITLVGFYGLLFLTYALRNSIWGIASVFAFTGFLGYTLGPIIGMFLKAGAADIVTQSLTITAVAFIGLSATALISKKDFSFLSGFITAGFFVLLGAMVLSFFVHTPILTLAMSGGFAIFSCVVILYQTSQIVNGGERNYILATITLYVQLYNLLLSLMQILAALRGDR